MCLSPLSVHCHESLVPWEASADKYGNVLFLQSFCFVPFYMDFFPEH